MPLLLFQLFSSFFRDLIEYPEQFFFGLRPQHSDTRVAEVGDALEKGAGGKMAAYVEDAPSFVEQVHAVGDLLAQHFHFPLEAQGGEFFSRS